MSKLSRSLRLTDRAEAGAWLTLEDRTQKPVGGAFPPLAGVGGEPIAIEFLGIDSRPARELQRARQAAAQSRFLERARGEQDDAPTVTVDQIAEQQANDIELLVTLTRDWRNVPDEDGAPLPCDAALARELYEGNPLVVDQALQFLNDRPRFFGVSSTTSAPSSNTAPASIA